MFALKYPQIIAVPKLSSEGVYTTDMVDLSFSLAHRSTGTFLAMWRIYLFKELFSLRKHSYSNILKILPPKTENFQIKSSDIFHISAHNIDCGYSLEPPPRGGSNGYPQFMSLSRNKKNNVYPCKPHTI